jgi:hypothetical protein
MKKLFTILAFCVSAITGFAGTPLAIKLQSQNTIQASQNYNQNLRSVSCDTVFNFTSDTTAVYRLQSPAQGYLSGNGSVNATLKIGGLAERFSDPVAVGEYVTSGMVFFALSRINPGDSNVLVTAYLYDTTGASPYGGSAPGNALDSATVTLGSIARDITNNHRATVFSFPNQPVMTTTDFFIGITLPWITGDTIVVYTTTENSGSGNGWLDIPDNGGWASYHNLLSATFGDFIEASVCPARSCPPISVSATEIAGGTSAYVTTNGGANPYTYTWNTTPAQHTDTATGLTVGTSYVVTVTDHNGCSVMGFITSSSCPTISATATQASPTSASVSATGGASPYTYSWGTSPSQTSDTAIGLAPGGTYSVTVIDHNGCTGTASVTISSCPAISVAATQSGSTGIASASGGASPYTYAWSNNAIGDSALNLVNGTTYTVTATDHNGCSGTAMLTIAGIAAIEAGVTNFSVYPNPSNGVFTLSVNLIAASDVSISIIDMTGSKIYESIDKGVKSIYSSIDLSTAAAGVYFVSVKTDKGIANQRIVIK